MLLVLAQLGGFRPNLRHQDKASVAQEVDECGDAQRQERPCEEGKPDGVLGMGGEEGGPRGDRQGICLAKGKKRHNDAAVGAGGLHPEADCDGGRVGGRLRRSKGRRLLVGEELQQVGQKQRLFLAIRSQHLAEL